MGVKLSQREIQIVSLIASGKQNKEIASELGISVSTVKSYVSNMMDRLLCNNRTDIVVKALKEGRIDL